MQAINPVDVHVKNEYHNESNIKKNGKTSSRGGGRQPIRMRTHIVNKTKNKTKKPKTSIFPSSNIPKQVVIPKLVLPDRSRSSSSNREPWVPPPGRSTKGQKVSWQSPKSRLEINPVTEILIDDHYRSLDTERDKLNLTFNSQTNTLSTDESEKLMKDIQNYEKRIQGLIDGIGMLKDRMRIHANQEQTDQLRSDIDSSLLDLEQLQQNYTQNISNRISNISRSQSLSPIRNNNRSSSVDEQRQRPRTTPKVSFQDDPIIERRRARSTTPIKGPIHLNPDRERLLISLAASEADVTQITKQLSLVKDILTKLKLDDLPVSFEIEQLYQHRNELLHLIERFEHSNSNLKEFLHHQYHLEAEHGITNDKYDTLRTRIHELEHENEQIRHLLLNRENDNIALQTELERIRTHSIGFDTMKSSLEHNRGHLQRELYAKEGEINRLQCALRSLERDLQRGRYHSNNTHRSTRRTPTNAVTQIKATTIEKLKAELHDRDCQINELKRKLYDNKTDHTGNTNSEIIYLRSKLEQAERLANEYKAHLHTQTLKTSANNSKNHLSEIELEKIRARLQKRIEELEPLPELLRDAEAKNEKLQKHISELQIRSTEQSTFPYQYPSNDDQRTLQRKIISLEEKNEELLKTLQIKEEELRLAQSRLNAIIYDSTSTNSQNVLKNREDILGSKDDFPSKYTLDLEQQRARLRLECAQLKQEKDELERRFTSQLSDLRNKLEQSNNTNRTMQKYVNSLKTTYTTLFNDTLPASLTRYTTT